MTPALILASTSTFRKSLLEKFNYSFTTHAPDVDETPYKDETAEQLVQRLSFEKAADVATHYQQGIVIGSDQVALFDDGKQSQILGKPHTKANAIKQLSQFSGNTVTFLTGLTIFDAKDKKHLSKVEIFQVQFRQLSHAQIEAYLESEQPYNCAGSFKSEGLGICLFERFIGDDPNSLVGLPLITLNKLLLQWDIDILLLQSNNR